MKKLKCLMVIGLVIVFCCGMVSAAGADMVKKIIIFYEDVSQEERNQYAMDWEPYGVSTVMDLPFMNGMVLMAPVDITAEELANDYRVASVESDGKVELQAIAATGEGGAGEGGAGEGGAGEGGATSFITPTTQPPSTHRPWGMLKLYEQPYDPLSLTDFYDSNTIPKILDNLLNHNIGRKPRIAVFDTGVDMNHPELIDNNHIRDGIDLVHMIEGIPEDDNGHGTHVIGTFCGDNLGLVKKVDLFVVKVLDQDALGDVSSIIMGLQWAIDNNIKIVNMSFAFREDNPAVRFAVQKAYEEGIIMVAAVGNHSNWEDEGGTGEGGAGEGGAGEGGAGEGGAGEGGAGDDGTTGNPYPVMYPAAYPEVIAVGAHDAFGDITGFSNTGPEMDIIAPGTNVVSTDIDNGFGICNGTSMATPHVTGAIGLMLLRDRRLTSDEIKTILKNTSLDGELNLIGALEAVK